MITNPLIRRMLTFFLISGSSSHVAPEADAGVEHPEKQRRPVQAEFRNEKKREKKGRGQRADIIESEHARDEVLKIQLVLQNPHQQRNLQTDQRADDENRRVKNDTEIRKLAKVRKRSGAENPPRTATASSMSINFSARCFIDKARKPRADAHRKKINADDQRKLRDRIAENITRKAFRQAARRSGRRWR